jgi:hypothetical protein
MIVLGIFAALALLMACVGIYGVISHLVGNEHMKSPSVWRLGPSDGMCCGWCFGMARRWDSPVWPSALVPL